ncbi:MAG TPA: LemA family protein [candidate division Zixibacteria bacterium]|nr:LemA family protein [candidate division Zixibacteria bacterium]
MGTVLIVGLIAVAAIFIGWFIGIYNSLVRLKNNIKKAWSNIDVLLKQRHDELSKLLDTVKGYMKYEERVLKEVTEARTAFLNAGSVADKAQASNMMTGALKSLFAVAENYPELKANQNFIQFQSRISELENQIADRREFYNDSVNTFNIRIEQIPDMFIARMLGYTSKELFQVAETDKQDIKIDFD